MKQTTIPTSPKPHIIPAFYNWLSENDPKVFMGVIIDFPEVDISPYPSDKLLEKVKIAVKEGEELELTMIRLNTNPQAVNNFTIMETGISFQCRLSGVVTNVFAPYDAIIHLYCPDSGFAQAFGLDLELLNQTPEKTPVVVTEKQEPPKRAHLSLVK